MELKLPKDHLFFDEPRFGFGAQFITDGDDILDVGCSTSGFGFKITQYRDVTYTGIDRDGDRIEASKCQLKNDTRRISFIHVLDQPQFADNSFDVVTLFDVLEHIDDQIALLGAIHRWLKPNGRVIVTVPKKYIFSFLDTGNVKFRFPRLNKWLVTIFKGKKYFEHRFTDNEFGLIGDVEAAKGWHQHFSEEELTDLLQKCSFDMVQVDGMGLFGELLTIAGTLCQTEFNRLRRIDERLFDWYQLFVCAKKS